MKITKIVVGAFLAILFLFGANFSIYLLSNQKRNASLEYLRQSTIRQGVVASLKQRLSDLQKLVELLSQLAADTSTGAVSPDEAAEFQQRLEAVLQESQQLVGLTPAEGLSDAETFAGNVRSLTESWRSFYENFGVHHEKAIVELITRSHPLSETVMAQLADLQRMEKRNVEFAGTNSLNVSRLTVRFNILIFAISLVLTVTGAALVFRAVGRIIAEEQMLLAITTALSSELHLIPLLVKIMDTTTAILNADRSTLFLHDPKTGELWSQVAQGLRVEEIRFPSHLGIAGSVFTSRETINIRSAYDDARFNPEVDRKTGYRTDSILCMPVINKAGTAIGVIQVLNKKGGHFSRTDERRLEAFSSQASVAIENAKLFDDVLNMKNYNESILLSLSNGVITLDAEDRIVKCNEASLRILKMPVDGIVGRGAREFFVAANSWVAETVQQVAQTEKPNISLDTELLLATGQRVSVNMTVVPLVSVKKVRLGSMLVFEDITQEKRLKGTMARYLTKEVADKLLEGGDNVLGGQRQVASVLFSDIRGFTTLSEQVGSPEAVVTMLNEYFTVMIDIIFGNKGILDKYIGDAIMAVFGVPFSSGGDADQAVRTAIEMMKALDEFNRRRVAEEKHPINIGIGINTSDVLSGNIGSLKRMDYTVIGDGVNLASRLEGINKYYGTNILISEFTLKDLAGSYLCREAGLIRVKGKTEPVAVFEILDFHDSTSFPNMSETLGCYTQGLASYRARNWRQGIANFQNAIRLNERDQLSRIYLERCRHFLHEPPAQSWDGVHDMEGK